MPSFFLAIGFPDDARRELFAPHVTLGRVVVGLLRSFAVWFDDLSCWRCQPSQFSLVALLGMVGAVVTECLWLFAGTPGCRALCK